MFLLQILLKPPELLIFAAEVYKKGIIVLIKIDLSTQNKT